MREQSVKDAQFGYRFGALGSGIGNIGDPFRCRKVVVLQVFNDNFDRIFKMCSNNCPGNGIANGLVCNFSWA